MNIRYPIYEGVYRILTHLEAHYHDSRCIIDLPPLSLFLFSYVSY